MPLPQPSIADEQLLDNLTYLERQRLEDQAEARRRASSLEASLGAAGMLSMTAASTAPTGWLLCDGSAVSRTTYAALFAAIGTSYGTGDGSTTFNLPDLRGRAPYGKGSHTDADALGDNDGVALGSRTPKHTLTTSEIPSHTHAMNMTQGLNVAGGGGGASGYLWHNSGAVGTGATGGGAAHDHGFLVVNFIIKI